jgi:hypothetical protein
LRDEDVIDLYDRVGVGTKVVVLPNDPRAVAAGDRKNAPAEGTAGVRVTRISTPSAWRFDQQSGGVGSLLIGHLVSGRRRSSLFSSFKRTEHAQGLFRLDSAVSRT